MSGASGRGLHRIRGALHKHLPPSPYQPEPKEMRGRRYRVTGGEHAGRTGTCVETRDNWAWQKAVRLRFNDWLVKGYETDQDGEYVLDEAGRPRHTLVPVTAPVWVGYLEEEGRHDEDG